MKNPAPVAVTRGREFVTKPTIDQVFHKNHWCLLEWTTRSPQVHADGSADAAVLCYPALLAIPKNIEAVTKPITFAVDGKDSVVDNISVQKSPTF